MKWGRHFPQNIPGPSLPSVVVVVVAAAALSRWKFTIRNAHMIFTKTFLFAFCISFVLPYLCVKRGCAPGGNAFSLP
jgi:hypothetical protein